jgi:FMN-dependent NADH-azoreductase
MTALLYVEASPLKQRSRTIKTAHAFLDAYQSANPRDRIDTVDLWEEALPAFDGPAIEAKFAVLRKNEFTSEQHAKWNALQAVARRFNAARKYVFGVPMWNFGIPYVLKHYIDVVTLAGENWIWTQERGYRGLLSGKKALLIYSSAGAYTVSQPVDPADFQKPYLRHWLAFIGVRDVEEINVAPTLAAPDLVEQVEMQARSRALALARSF